MRRGRLPREGGSRPAFIPRVQSSRLRRAGWPAISFRLRRGAGGFLSGPWQSLVLRWRRRAFRRLPQAFMWHPRRALAVVEKQPQPSPPLNVPGYPGLGRRFLLVYDGGPPDFHELSQPTKPLGPLGGWRRRGCGGACTARRSSIHSAAYGTRCAAGGMNFGSRTIRDFEHALARGLEGEA